MEFKKYDNIKDFANDNLNLLLEKEWLNNLMVGNIKDGLQKGIDGWLLATVKKDGRTELIMLLRRPWKLVFYSPTSNNSDELFKFAAEEVFKVDKEVPGINGICEDAEKFAKYYCKLAGKQVKLHLPMRILLLNELKEAKLRNDVTYRRAKLKDKDVLKKYILDFHKEALGEQISEEELDKHFYKHFESTSGGYFVLEKDGKIVAQTVSSRKLERGKCVSGVYTPVEERCKGYAFNLVYRVSKEFLDNGAEYCVLFTDDTNPISNHVYEKIGYKKMYDTEELDFVDEAEC